MKAAPVVLSQAGFLVCRDLWLPPALVVQTTGKLDGDIDDTLDRDLVGKS
jgi:hypothetical protein